MNSNTLFKEIVDKQSFLCVGLDSDIDKIPTHLRGEKDPIFEFNKQIIDATIEHCVAYKPNIAFYEALGPAGWESLAKTLEYLPDNIFTIADAKRGDIGNTSLQYAKTFFEFYDFDAVTIAPYMGEDSVRPFLTFDGKWSIILALTSNTGSKDFQFLESGGTPLYEEVLQKSASWGTPDNMMFVAGATHPGKFTRIRELCPDHFLLVPGVGAQGGNLEKLCAFGMNKRVGLLVNSSRGIIFNSTEKDFATRAGEQALHYRNRMSRILESHAIKYESNE